MTTPALIGTAEASALLGVNPSTLTRWAKSGRLTPAIQMPGLNGALLFNRADVEALLRSPEPAER